MINRILFALIFCGLFSAAYGEVPQKDKIENIYESAVRALHVGDCDFAVEQLGRFKIAAADILKKNPSFALQVEQQIADCKGVLYQGRIRLRANLDDALALPKEDAISQEGVGAAASGISTGSISIFLLIFILLLVL